MRVVLYTAASYEAGSGKGAYAYWIALPGSSIRKSGVLTKIKNGENAEWQGLMTALLALLDSRGALATVLVIYANVEKGKLGSVDAGSLSGICRALLARFKRGAPGSAWEVRAKTGEEGAAIQEWCQNTANALLSVPDC